MGSSDEDQYTFLIISRSDLLKMKMFQTRVVENINSHILCSVTFLKHHAIYEIMWKNIVQPDRPQMAIWHMCIACWVTKVKNTHSEYITLNTLQEHTST
jgi:hypothetical protein